MSELYAVGWRVRGRPLQWGVGGVSVAGAGGLRGARPCGVRWRWPVAGLRHAGSRRRRRPVAAALGRRLAEGLETRQEG